MITRFSVKSYKCLADISLPLTPIHVIIGQNDTGKTSLLEAILALALSTETELKLAFRGEWTGRQLVFEGAKRPEIEFKVELESFPGDAAPITYGLKVEFPSMGRDCVVAEEWVEAERRVDLNPVGDRRRTVAVWGAGSSHEPLRRIAADLTPVSLYRFDPKAMMVPAALDPDRRFRMDSDGFGLPTLLDDIKGDDDADFDQLSESFCAYFPQFRKVRLETVRAVARDYEPSGRYTTRPGVGKGVVFATSSGGSIPAEQASDGAILFLGFLALIHSPKAPKLLLIEEPEKGVYPRRLEQVIELIRKLHASKNAKEVPQIVMTTHSPYLLSSFGPEEVTLMSRDERTGLVRARPLRDAPHIHERLGGGEFYLGELWYNLSEQELFADVR